MSGVSPDSYRLSVFTAAKLDLGFSAGTRKTQIKFSRAVSGKTISEDAGRACNQN